MPAGDRDATRPARGVGVSSGRRQSAVLVPVAEAEQAVGRWRDRYDPVATAGVPAHVTLVVPWVAPEEIVDGHLEALAKLAATVPPWSFELTDVAWFGKRVLWLVPRPAEPFVRLTAAIAARFGTPPWAGEFDEVVPHLTVAHADRHHEVDFDPVVDDLRSQLPVRCRAAELWVMAADGERWSVLRTCPLGGAPAPTTAPPASP